MSCSTIEENESFETALQKLEAVVRSLEGGEIALAELLRQYTEGVMLSNFCLEQLTRTERAMDKILHERGGAIEEGILEIKGESTDV